MGILLFAVLLGLIPAMIAKKKGRSFIGWWIYGALLWIIALPHSLLIKPIGIRKCPHCAEDIKKEASVCRYCGREVTPLVGSKDFSPPPPGTPWWNKYRNIRKWQ